MDHVVPDVKRQKFLVPDASCLVPGGGALSGPWNVQEKKTWKHVIQIQKMHSVEVTTKECRAEQLYPDKKKELRISH